MTGIKVTLKSSDSHTFVVDESVVFESQVLKDMIEDLGAQTIIPVPQVTGETLAIIIEYCEYHSKVQNRSDEEPNIPKGEIEDWDAKFIREHALDSYTNICQVIGAANYLNIQKLLNLATQQVADMITSKCADVRSNKSVDDFRSFFEIDDDFSHEEQQKIMQENEWAF